jgi:alpha-D-xyloside xylohydrolase
MPIMRALGFEFPNDAQAWAQDQEFMVGSDLLAAPVTADRAEADGAAGSPTPVQVYLPAGQWIDLYSGQVVTGGQTITRMTSLDELPLYLRAGGAIGFNARTPDIWGNGWGTDDLSVPDLTGWMYAPGRPATTAIASAPGQLHAVTSNDRVHLTLTGTTPRAQVLVLAQQPPSAVTVNGQPIPQAADPSALQGMDQGWTFTTGQFGGVLVKLTPSNGNASIDVES